MYMWRCDIVCGDVIGVQKRTQEGSLAMGCGVSGPRCYDLDIHGPNAGECPAVTSVEGRGDMTVEAFLGSLSDWEKSAGLSADELDFAVPAVEFLDLKYDGKIAEDRTQTMSQLMDQRTGEFDRFSLLTERVKPGLIDKVQQCLRCWLVI